MVFMNNEEKTQQELEILEATYRQKFPHAQAFDYSNYSLNSH